MAIQFNLPDIGRRISPEETGIPDYISALSRGLELGYKPRRLENSTYAQELANKLNEAKAQYASKQERSMLQHRNAGTENLGAQTRGLNIENQFLPDKLRAALQATKQSNAINAPYAQNASRAFEADISGKESNNLKQKILNNYLSKREEAEIEELKKRSQYYGQGGYGQSTGAKDYNAYLNAVAEDNPHLNPSQIREASNALAEGRNSLPDGTQLNPMSYGTKVAFDRSFRPTTTAAQINSSNLANQAESEIDIFNKYSNEWIKPYGTTYYGHSPQQIIDSFKNDEKSQTKLGKLIAANTLQYEIAQIRNRIAGGQPGITATHELMQEAKQHIDASWPRLSTKAREAAAKNIDLAIKAGLAARNKIGIGAGGAYTRQFTSVNPEIDYSNMSDEELLKIASGGK